MKQPVFKNYIWFRFYWPDSIPYPQSYKIKVQTTSVPKEVPFARIIPKQGVFGT